MSTVNASVGASTWSQSSLSAGGVFATGGFIGVTGCAIGGAGTAVGGIGGPDTSGGAGGAETSLGGGGGGGGGASTSGGNGNPALPGITGIAIFAMLLLLLVSGTWLVGSTWNDSKIVPFTVVTWNEIAKLVEAPGARLGTGHSTVFANPFWLQPNPKLVPEQSTTPVSGFWKQFDALWLLQVISPVIGFWIQPAAGVVLQVTAPVIGFCTHDVPKLPLKQFWLPTIPLSTQPSSEDRIVPFGICPMSVVAGDVIPPWFITFTKKVTISPAMAGLGFEETMIARSAGEVPTVIVGEATVVATGVIVIVGVTAVGDAGVVGDAAVVGTLVGFPLVIVGA